MNIWRAIKAVIYTTAAVLLIVFMEYFIENLKFFIGGLIMAYGLEAVITHLCLKKSFKTNNMFFWGAMEVLLGIVLIFLLENGDTTSTSYIVTCIVWAVWSMLNGAVELEELVIHILHKKPTFLEVAVVIVSVVLSVTLILTPGEHHARIHGWLLFVELLTGGLIFPYFDILFEMYMKKREEKKKALENQGSDEKK